MNSGTRYVFDSNVIISALLFDTSAPAQAFSRSLHHGTILVSRWLVEELGDVLGRRKFDRYVTSEERDRFLGSLIRETELIEVNESIQKCRDPKDDQILALAVAGKASYIVTGDSDLLTLDPFRGVRIVSPTQLLGLFGDTSRQSGT